MKVLPFLLLVITACFAASTADQLATDALVREAARRPVVRPCQCACCRPRPAPGATAILPAHAPDCQCACCRPRPAPGATTTATLPAHAPAPGANR